MTPHNALQQMLRSNHEAEDPGDAGTIAIDRDRLYCSLTHTTGAGTRILAAPSQPGLVCHVGCIAFTSGTLVVTVKNSAAATTGTITFSAATQWMGLVSVEITSGVYAWHGTDLYAASTSVPMTGDFDGVVNNGTITNLLGTSASIGSVLGTNISCASMSVSSNFRAASILATNLSVGTQATIPNILCSSNLSVASILATNLSVGTQATIPNILCSSNLSVASVLATNLSVGTQATIPNILCSSNLSVASALATNVSIATGLTAGTIVGTNLTAPNITNASKLVMGGTIASVGGTAATASLCSVLAGPLQMISVTDAAKNYFKMPAAAVGLCVNVINLGSTVGLLGAAGESIASATSVALATADAVGSALELVCDGTNWWKRAK